MYSVFTAIIFISAIILPGLIKASEDDFDKREEVVRTLLDILANREEGIVHDLSASEKQEIVATHNSLRSTVSPPAANMQYVVWDDRLANDAANWASDCNWWHKVQKGEGQNMWAGHEAPDLEQAIKAWYYNEVQYYDYDRNACMLDKVCGHYFQVAWAKVSKIGCVRSFCPVLTRNDKSDDSTNLWLFVCHYDVSVYSGARPYIEDESCSLCPEEFRKCAGGKLCQKPSLCGTDSTPSCDCRLGHCGEGHRDDNNCMCNCCQPGFSTNTCLPCGDQKSVCGSGKIYPDNRYCRFNAVKKKCPAMCGECAKWECK